MNQRVCANKQPNRPKEIARLQGLIAGAQKHFANVASLTFGGATFTLVALVAMFQALVNQLTNVDQARAALKVQLSALRTQAPATRATARAFTAFVRAMFGNQPDVLLDFALQPHKTAASRTVEEKQAAVAKARATREARHTTGPKARKAIKGQVPEAPAAQPQAPEVAPVQAPPQQQQQPAAPATNKS